MTATVWRALQSRNGTWKVISVRGERSHLILDGLTREDARFLESLRPERVAVVAATRMLERQAESVSRVEQAGGGR